MSRFVKDEENRVPKFLNIDDIAKTEMYFFDNEGNACDEEHAVRYVVKAYNKEGQVINESWGYCVAREQENKKRL